jgi:hypothetical protein
LKYRPIPIALKVAPVRILILAIIISCMLPAGACKKEKPKNVVDFDQIEPDNSNDYRYIFRNDIRQQEERNGRYKKKF